MNTRHLTRISTRALAVGAATAMLGAVAMTATASSASAAPTARTGQARQFERPVYLCEFVHERGDGNVAGEFCRALEGATRHGIVIRPLIMGVRGERFDCHFGIANVPDEVEGLGCV